MYLEVINTMVTSANVYMPTPGKAGPLEFMMQDILAAVVYANPANFGLDAALLSQAELFEQSQDIGGSIAFMDRFMSYYLPTLISGTVFTGFIIKHQLSK
jgi:uncharacterized membrane protein YbhN (UPF0104 family)